MEFLRGAGFGEIEKPDDLALYCTQAGNKPWSEMDERDQRTFLDLLEAILSSALPQTYLRELLIFQGNKKVLISFDLSERKVLAFLEKSTIRESPVVEALIDCLVAHNSIRLGYMIAPSLLKEAIRDDLSRWGITSLHLTASKVWLWDLGARLFSFSSQTLDIWVINDYSSSVIIKRI